MFKEIIEKIIEKNLSNFYVRFDGQTFVVPGSNPDVLRGLRFINPRRLTDYGFIVEDSLLSVSPDKMGEVTSIDEAAPILKLENFPNTRVQYLYRDGDNYKVHSSYVLRGGMDNEQEEKIWASCFDGDSFIPRMVMLPENKFDSETEADTPWFELQYFEPTFEEAGIEQPTTEELVSLFEAAAANNWGGEC